MAEELIEWVKLPQDLQHRFFELARRESEKIGEDIQRLISEFKGLEDDFKTYIWKMPASNKTVTVVAVDGSRSLRLSERLGVRYGVFAAGAVFLRGVEKKGEVFRAGVFKRSQALSPDKSRFFFSLLSTYAERKVALEVLGKCDLLILDGGFYSFVYGASLMKKSGLYKEREEEVLKETFEATENLRRSGKTISVIKRSHTRAIGGYLALEDRGNPFKTIIDKLILSVIMPEKSYFAYGRLLGDRPVQVYTRIAHLASIGFEGNLMDEAEKRVFAPFENLGLEKEGLRQMRRLQARFCEAAPPCEIEYPQSISEGKLLEMLGQKGFFNEATNLPIALDLVDSMVTIPPRFTEEFVSEVEGRVLEASSIEDRRSQETVKLFFTLLNPQKPY